MPILQVATTQAMTPTIALVLAVLGVTILLFVTEALRVDVIAVTILAPPLCFCPPFCVSRSILFIVIAVGLVYSFNL